jgi:DNA mismatch repair protein MutL
LPIQILPARLANQIAAGEVVERPASVIKELIENSLDAGATRIDIEVDKGGHKRILVRDNGSGIPEQELQLALSRHATSKITCLDDLEQIISLGFRGEALASISAVARLTLSSKPAAQQQGWQARAEGRDMAVSLAPVAHPDGTSVEVVDLFFNTPARRKFLRTEKTEFAHIDEIVRRVALSRFDVAFSLKHNGKILRQYPQANNDQARDKRIALVCGGKVMDEALKVQSEFQQLHLSGWLCTEPQPQNDIQYFYVNGRMMRDKLINHAIRQAFEGWLPPDTHPAFVLYLQLDAREVDVNVHPAKHEVRFHQSRMVHDFIYRALRDMLEQSTTEEAKDNNLAQTLPPAEPAHNYIRPLQSRVTETASTYSNRTPAAPRSPSAGASEAYQRLMKTSEKADLTDIDWMLIRQRYLLLEWQQQYWLLPLYKLQRHRLISQVSRADVSQPLLMPVAISADQNMRQNFHRLAGPLEAMGLDLQLVRDRLLLKQVPAGLRNLDWSAVLPALLQGEENDLTSTLAIAAAPEQQSYDQAQAQALWHWFVSSHSEWQKQLARFGYPLPDNWPQDYAN